MKDPINRKTSVKTHAMLVYVIVGGLHLDRKETCFKGMMV